MIVFALTLAIVVSGQDRSAIIQAIGSGNADNVARHMDSNVELCFDESVQFLSKDRAKATLSSFFSKNPPASFRSLHKGNSKGKDSQYDIGVYRSTNGKEFRVYIFAKDVGSASLIQELRFDSQK